MVHFVCNQSDNCSFSNLCLFAMGKFRMIFMVCLLGTVLSPGSLVSGEVYTIGGYDDQNLVSSVALLHPGRGPPIINVTFVASQTKYDFNVAIHHSSSFQLKGSTAYYFESSNPIVVQVTVLRGSSNMAAYQAPLLSANDTVFMNDVIAKSSRRPQGMFVVCYDYSTSLTILYEDNSTSSKACSKFETTIIDSEGSQPVVTELRSNYPVGVISFHDCAVVPRKPGSCDLLMSAAPSVSDLDAYYILLPIGGRDNDTGYWIQVVGYEDDTRVSVKSTGVLLADDVAVRARRHVEFDVTTSQPAVVECSKPCMVKQYNKNRKPDRKSDGFSMVVNGLKGFSSILTFLPPTSDDADSFVSIIAHSPESTPHDKIEMTPVLDTEMIPWTPIEDAEGFYYSVWMMMNRTVQRYIQSNDWKVTISGYWAAHSNKHTTAYGLSVNTFIKDESASVYRYIGGPPTGPPPGTRDTSGSAIDAPSTKLSLLILVVLKYL